MNVYLPEMVRLREEKVHTYICIYPRKGLNVIAIILIVI